MTVMLASIAMSNGVFVSARDSEKQLADCEKLWIIGLLIVCVPLDGVCKEWHCR
jgi:hypothetical protein